MGDPERGGVELHRTEIDGITTFWSEAPGPLRASLIFRTGWADETLVTAGRTHLLEHLVVSATGNPGPERNGGVGATLSGFHAFGSPEEVTGFLMSVGRALCAVPGDRLETERRIVEAESATGRSNSLYSIHLRERYGAQGYGLAGVKNFGVLDVSEEQLNEIAQSRFGRENAVLWFMGQPPSGMTIDLPGGPRLALPGLIPSVAGFPCWFTEAVSGRIGASGTLSRTGPATIVCELAQRRLNEALRTREGLSYAPSVLYEPLDAMSAHLLLAADSQKARHRELCHAFGQVLEGLSDLSDEELESSKAMIGERWVGSLAPSQDQRIAGELQRAAADYLFGRELDPLQDVLADLESATVSDVVACVQEVKTSLIVSVPENVTIEPWMGEPGKVGNVAVIEGDDVSLLGPGDAALRCGDEGVSILSQTGPRAVRFDDLAAALTYDDGGVCLIGRDGQIVPLEPTLWQDGEQVCSRALARVPAEFIVKCGPRPAEAIPRPGIAPSVNKAKAPDSRSGKLMTKLADIGLIVTMVLVFPISILIAFIDPGEPLLGALVFLVPFCTVLAFNYYGRRLVHGSNPAGG